MEFPLRKHLELVRLSHTIFALPFALLAAVMAFFATPPVPVRPIDWLAILLCMVAARTAAMGFNRIVDRDLDALNPRTRMRHLPAGEISLRSAVLFTFGASIAFVGSTLLFLPCNRLPFALSVPVLVFLFAYSYTKRFTVLSHFWLGAALMLAPVSAWIALRGQWLMIDPADLIPAVILGGAVLFWVAGFDIIYACQDAAFDRASGLRSIPGRYGIPAALRLSMLCHLGTVVTLALLPLVFPLGWIYWSAVGAIAVLLAYEHFLVRPDDLDRVNVAFFNVNAVISLGLLVLTTIDLLLAN